MSGGNPAPGFRGQPDRRMDYSPAGRRVRVVVGGVTVADSVNAIALAEADHPLVYYFPQSDTQMDLAHRTSHSTHCPFKGDASYWSLEVNGRRLENVLWAYETPFDDAVAIKGHVAFYTDRVDSVVTD